MSIQQALNNMLMSTQIAAGLYAHSPAGQKQAEISRTEKAYKQAEAHEVKWRAPKEGEEHISDVLAKQQMERAERLAMLNPTEANIARAAEDREAYEASMEEFSSKKSSEAKALESIAERIGSIDERIKNFEKRKTILKKRKGGTE